VRTLGQFKIHVEIARLKNLSKALNETLSKDTLMRVRKESEIAKY